MLDTLNLAVAILLPWLAGVACLARCWRTDAPGRWPALIGCGYLFGMFGTTGLLLGPETLTGRWSYGGVVFGLTLIAVGASAVNYRYLRPVPGQSLAHGGQTLTTGSRVLIIALALLLAWRLGGFLLEVLWRPAYAWDNWHYWGLRAKAFFVAGHWTESVSGNEWLRSLGGSYYGGGSRHPPTVSAIQLWAALALGRWDESLTLIHWWFAGVALLAAVYGQLRVAWLPATWALAAVYLLVSIPIVGTHMALAGYADLWTTAFVTLAALGMVVAFRCANPWQWLVVVLAAIAIVASKQVGFVIAAILGLAIVFAWLPARLGALLLAVALVVLPVWAYTLGIDFDLPMLGRVVVNSDQIIIPRAGVVELRPLWGVWLQRLVIDGSWHLLFWLAPVAFAIGVPAAWCKSEHRGLLALTAGLFSTIAGAYLLTRQVAGLQDGTGINRQLMVMAPALIIWAVLIAWDGWVRRRADEPSESHWPERGQEYRSAIG